MYVCMCMHTKSYIKSYALIHICYCTAATMSKRCPTEISIIQMEMIARLRVHTCIPSISHMYTRTHIDRCMKKLTSTKACHDIVCAVCMPSCTNTRVRRHASPNLSHLLLFPIHAKVHAGQAQLVYHNLKRSAPSNKTWHATHTNTTPENVTLVTPRRVRTHHTARFLKSKRCMLSTASTHSSYACLPFLQDCIPHNGIHGFASS
jgi:hypothetical protein